MFTPTSLYQMLNEAVSDGGASALGRIAVIARDGDELEIIYPAYAALVTWGERGLQEMVRIAIQGGTVKIKSAALTLLGGIAATGQIPNLRFPIIDHRFLERANATLEPSSARALARQALRQLVMAVPTGDLMNPVSQSFTRSMGKAGRGEPKSARQLAHIDQYR